MIDIDNMIGMGVWAGARAPPPNFYGRAEIHASFGQNIKISKKLCYVRKNFSMCAKITVYKGKYFWYGRKIFCMFAKIMGYYVKFLFVSGKNFLVTSPPSLVKNFGRNIN